MHTAPASHGVGCCPLSLRVQRNLYPAILLSAVPLHRLLGSMIEKRGITEFSNAAVMGAITDCGRNSELWRFLSS
jgi:hypothetical protein